MSKPLIFPFLCLLLSGSVLSGANPPNVILMMADDLGYNDLACYGSKTNKTPRLDQLAKEGTLFTSFYTQTVCGPSRSALLTGRYPCRSKGWGMPASEITFGELMQKAGYQTACIGKWDVSNRKANMERMPNAQGFDYYFGTLGANDGGGVKFHENNEPAGTSRDMGGLTTLYTDKSIEFLKKKRDPKKPFALYLAHTMMHTIIDASDRFRGKSKGGLYGDVVEEFDYETGRLLDVLEELGLSENTLFIYTSDNGPNREFANTIGSGGGLRGIKRQLYEGGLRAAMAVRWPGKVPAGRVNDAVFASIDFMPTFANLCGFNVPKDRHLDGIDQTDLLLGKRETGRDYFYFNKAGVRKGKWKYLKADVKVPKYATIDREKLEELYDLEKDPSEKNNIASKHPEKVAELKQLLQEVMKK